MENNNEIKIVYDKNKKFVKNVSDCVYYCKKLNDLIELNKNKNIEKDVLRDLNCYISCYNLYK
jgi:hypothetical protein